jgi:hypothetical protein
MLTLLILWLDVLDTTLSDFRQVCDFCLLVHCNSIFINIDTCFEICVGPSLDRICGLLLLYIHQEPWS